MDGDPPQHPVPLPFELAGEHVDPLEVVPRWWPRFGPPVVTVGVVAEVARRARDADWPLLVILVLLASAAIVVTFRSAARSRTTTTLDPEGVTVSVHGRAPTTVAWSEVRGVRVFTRRVTPQLLLDEGRVVLSGLTTAQAELLAQWLADRGHREVVLEVDGREHRL